MKYKILIILVFLPFLLKSQNVLFSTETINFEENKRSFLDFEYDDFNVFASVKFDFSKKHYYSNEYRFLQTIFFLENKEYSIGADISKRLGLSEYITAGLRLNTSTNDINYVICFYKDQFLLDRNMVEKRSKSSLSVFLGNEYRLPKHKILVGMQLYYNFTHKLTQKYSALLDLDFANDQPNFTVKNSPYFNDFEACVEAYYLTRVFSIYAKYRFTDIMIEDKYYYLEPNRLTFGLCIFILR